MANEEFQILKQRSLYSKLKRLFSTDAVIRNVGGKKLKVVDTDEVMYATDRNTLRDRFNRIRTSSYNQYSRDFTLSYQAARIELFRDYDTMDMDPIIASALDIYADEMTTSSDLSAMMKIDCPNEEIKNRILTNLPDVFNYASIHIRRGDYVSDKSASVYHGTVPLDYYNKAMTHLNGLFKDVKVFIFSNSGYASIRMTQRNYFDGAYLGCEFLCHRDTRLCHELLCMSHWLQDCERMQPAAQPNPRTRSRLHTMGFRGGR